MNLKIIHLKLRSFCRKSKDIEIDCRPSDALAVAVRAGSLVYVKEAVLEEAGLTCDEIDKITKKASRLNLDSPG